MEDAEKDISADFYASYRAYKGYRTPSLSKKDIRRFDAEIWTPAGFSPDMSCLELGSGTGSFLAYLAFRGLDDFHGVDHDPALSSVQPAGVAGHFTCADIWQYLGAGESRTFDRIVLLDVLEHFTADQGFRLLSMIKDRLSERGKIVIKAPNAASPWGAGYQFGDLTHRTAYSVDSLNQLATACGLRVAAIYEQRRGSRRRMVTDAIVHRFLSWALLTPPPFWGANLYCVMTLDNEKAGDNK